MRHSTWANCFGIDTWGVDFGLIDQNGALLGNPRCYRNGTEAGMAAVHAIVPQETLFWRRRAWDAVGGLDPSFQFALDWDLIARFQTHQVAQMM